MGGPAGEPLQVRQAQGRPAELTVQSAEASATVAIRSPAGIGACELKRTGEAWPSSVLVHLHLKGLEGLHITSGNETLKVSVSSTGGNRILQELVRGDTQIPLDEQSPYWSTPQIKGEQTDIPLRGGYFEYRIPAHLLRDNPKEIRIRWIDFHRG